MERNNTITDLKTGRIEALSDGIFAIAMTILVLSFEPILQQPVKMDERYLFKTLIGLWPDFLHYVESFIILGAFWFQHHRQFHYVKKVDMTMIFLNIMGLMFIGLIPFSTVLVSDYGNTTAVALLFEINLLIAGLIFFIHWLYVSKNHHLLDPDVDEGTIKFYSSRNLIIPITSLCAMIVSCINPRIGILVYFVVPLVLFLWKKTAYKK